jgi:hypothetical protein
MDNQLLTYSIPKDTLSGLRQDVLNIPANASMAHDVVFHVSQYASQMVQDSAEAVLTGHLNGIRFERTLPLLGSDTEATSFTFR